jgi:membrane dipeptidase
MMLVRSDEELRSALKQKKLASLIGVEGGHMIEDNWSYLDSLYKRGVRYLTLTWYNSTSWATSSLEESTNNVKNLKKGLNDFGKDLVKRMNELGIMVDVSHVGEQTFWDVMAVTTKPVLASHSSVYSVTPHHRNLKDDQIKAIAKNGGVVQVNFGPQFIDSTYPNRSRAFYLTHKSEIDSLRQIKYVGIGRYINTKYPKETDALRPPISMVFDHIDYIVKLVGVDYVGLGSDFDGTINTPHDLENVSKYPNITKGLLERGYSKRDIRKIMGGNFIRVFKANVQ